MQSASDPEIDRPNIFHAVSSSGRRLHAFRSPTSNAGSGNCAVHANVCNFDCGSYPSFRWANVLNIPELGSKKMYGVISFCSIMPATFYLSTVKETHILCTASTMVFSFLLVCRSFMCFRLISVAKRHFLQKEYCLKRREYGNWRLTGLLLEFDGLLLLEQRYSVRDVETALR